MDKKRIQALIDLWTIVAKEKLKLSSGEEHFISKKETDNKNFKFTIVLIKDIKKPKNYVCIINKGKVISKQEMPILFDKQLKEYCRSIAYEIEGCYPFRHTFIQRADKVLKNLVKLGFTPQHKVTLFEKIRKE